MDELEQMLEELESALRLAAAAANRIRATMPERVEDEVPDWEHDNFQMSEQLKRARMHGRSMYKDFIDNNL